jgi:hypothetical protein
MNTPQELELVIPNMDSGIAEFGVKAVLQNLPGIMSVLLIGRGAFVRYDPRCLDKSRICDAVSQAGYRARVFQEAETEETRSSPK